MSDIQAYIALCSNRSNDIEVNSDIGLKINGTDNFTLEAWVRMSDTHTRQVFFSQENVFSLGTENNGFFLTIKGYPLLTSNSSRNYIQPNNWTHLCVVCSKSQFYFYVDGMFNRFMTVSGTPPQTTGKPFVFGKEWKGDLFMLRILKIASDAGQIPNNMFKGPEQLITSWGKNVAAWYDFSSYEPFERVRSQRIEQACSLLRQYVPSVSFMADGASISIEQASCINPGGFDSDPYTIVASVYFTPVFGQDVYTLFSNRQVADGKGVVLSIEKRAGAFKVKSVFGLQELLSSSEMPLSRWTEIKTVYKDHCISIYIDGIESGISSIPSPDSSLYLERHLYIGAYRNPENSDTFSFRGRITQLQIFRRDYLCAHYTYYLNDYTNTVDSLPSSPNVSVKWGELITDVPPVNMKKQLKANIPALGNHSDIKTEAAEWWSAFFFLLISKSVFILSGIEISKNTRLLRFIENNFIDNPCFRTLAVITDESLISRFWKTCIDSHLLNHLVDTLFEESIVTKIWHIKIISSFSLAMTAYTDLFKDLLMLLRNHIAQKPSQLSLLPVGLLSVMPNSGEAGIESYVIPLRKNLWETYPEEIWTPWNKTVPLALCQEKLTKESLILKARFASCNKNEFVFYVKATGDLTGSSDCIKVTMKDGSSVPESVLFTFREHSFGSSGVRKDPLRLTWKYSTDQVTWQTMMDCEQTVYVLPRSPFKPWSTTENGSSSDLQQPWTQVLDYTCKWTQGMASAKEIATTVVEKIHQSIGLKYDKHQGTDHFIDDEVNFRLTRFLKQLSTGKESCLVNSRDCAAIVTTFANIIGCRLAEKFIGWNFHCNKVRLLGDTCWNKPFSEITDSSHVPGVLPYHEVAMLKGTDWKKNNDYLIYDASLQIDGSVTPDQDSKPDADRTALLPAGICFSGFPDGQSHCEEIPSGNSYREHLAANDSKGIGQCSYDITTTFNEDETYQYKPVR